MCFPNENEIISYLFGFLVFFLQQGNKRWNSLVAPEGQLYPWDDKSTYIKSPPFFEKMVRTNLYVLKVIGLYVSKIIDLILCWMNTYKCFLWKQIFRNTCTTFHTSIFPELQYSFHFYCFNVLTMNQFKFSLYKHDKATWFHSCSGILQMIPFYFDQLCTYVWGYR